MVDVIVPLDLWEEDKEGVLLGWLFSSGAPISAGDVIAEVTVDKSQLEICAPASGVLLHKVAENSILKRGDIIATIT